MGDFDQGEGERHVYPFVRLRAAGADAEWEGWLIRCGLELDAFVAAVKAERLLEIHTYGYGGPVWGYVCNVIVDKKAYCRLLGVFVGADTTATAL